MKFAAIASAMLAAAAIGGGTAHAATIVQTFAFLDYDFILNSTFGSEDDEPAFTWPLGAKPTYMYFNEFDPKLGTLESVTLDIPVGQATFTNIGDRDEDDPFSASYYDFYFINLAEPISRGQYLAAESGRLYIHADGRPIELSSPTALDPSYFIGTGTLYSSLQEWGLGAADCDAGCIEINEWDHFENPATLTYNYIPAGTVPEPATWAMMLAGLFGAGALLRRRSPLAAS